jgi:hypothetical protein
MRPAYSDNINIVLIGTDMLGINTIARQIIVNTSTDALLTTPAYIVNFDRKYYCIAVLPLY